MKGDAVGRRDHVLEHHVMSPAAQLAALRQRQAVSLYDPVDRLWADAMVAWIEQSTGAVGLTLTGRAS
jgi:hypothetical protein